MRDGSRFTPLHFPQGGEIIPAVPWGRNYTPRDKSGVVCTNGSAEIDCTQPVPRDFYRQRPTVSFDLESGELRMNYFYNDIKPETFNKALDSYRKTFPGRVKSVVLWISQEAVLGTRDMSGQSALIKANGFVREDGRGGEYDLLCFKQEPANFWKEPEPYRPPSPEERARQLQDKCRVERGK